MPLNIIMFNMSTYRDWQKGVSNRNYHILHNLANDDRVDKILAVDFLPFNFKKKVKIFLFNILGVKKQTNFVYGDGNSICWQASSKIYVYSTLNSELRLFEELEKIVKRLDMGNNLVVWSYNPFVPDLKKFVKKFENSKFIFDAVDDWSKFEFYKKQKKLLEKNYKTIEESADVIFVVSEKLKKKFSGHKNVFWMPNGVNLEHFKKTEKISLKVQEFFNKIKRPIIGYVGVIEKRLDVDLLEYLAQNNPDESLILAGQTWPVYFKRFRSESEVVKRLSKYKNVHFTHKYIPYSELPQYYHNFDVCIIPNKINPFTQSMNPMKLYEYLACSKPVVSTNVAGVEKFKDIIYIAKKGKEEFNNLIDEALKEDNEEFVNNRILVIKKHDWAKTTMEMLEKIKNYG